MNNSLAYVFDWQAYAEGLIDGLGYAQELFVWALNLFVLILGFGFMLWIIAKLLVYFINKKEDKKEKEFRK